MENNFSKIRPELLSEVERVQLLAIAGIKNPELRKAADKAFKDHWRKLNNGNQKA